MAYNCDICTAVLCLAIAEDKCLKDKKQIPLLNTTLNQPNRSLFDPQYMGNMSPVQQQIVTRQIDSFHRCHSTYEM